MTTTESAPATRTIPRMKQRYQAEIRDALIKVIDSNDHLLVVAMTGDWASYGITKPVTDWLQRV